MVVLTSLLAFTWYSVIGGVSVVEWTSSTEEVQWTTRSLNATRGRRITNACPEFTLVIGTAHKSRVDGFGAWSVISKPTHRPSTQITPMFHPSENGTSPSSPIRQFQRAGVGRPEQALE